MKPQYSSWCKYRVGSPTSTREAFAQINVFFAVRFPADPTVHGLALASVTARKHFTVKVIQDAELRVRRMGEKGPEDEADYTQYKPTKNDPNYTSYVAVDDSWSFEPEKLFVPLVSVFSTPIVVLPFYSSTFNMEMGGEMKWSSREDPHPVKIDVGEEGKKKRRYSSRPATHLALIDMYPERSHIHYYERMWSHYVV